MGARTGKYKFGARAGKYKLRARVDKYKFGARAGKYKLGARVDKYKFGARAGKYKLGARDGKYKFGARAGGQDQGRRASKRPMARKYKWLQIYCQRKLWLYFLSTRKNTQKTTVQSYMLQNHAIRDWWSCNRNLFCSLSAASRPLL